MDSKQELPRLPIFLGTLYKSFRARAYDIHAYPNYALANITQVAHELILKFTAPTQERQIDPLLGQLRKRYRHNEFGIFDGQVFPSLDAYCEEFSGLQNASKTPEHEELFTLLRDYKGGVFNKQYRMYGHVPLLNNGDTVTEFDFMSTGYQGGTACAAAKIHIVTDAKNNYRKRTHRNTMARNGMAYVKERYGIDLVPFRIEGKKTPNGWDVTAVNILTNERIAYRKL